MAEKSWPWLDSGGDRPVSAAMEQQTIGDEGFTGVLGGLEPTKDGSTVDISAGSAIVGNVRYVLDAEKTMTPAAGTRKDYIVVRYTAADRAAVLAVLQGTSGAFPALTQTAAVYEIAIAAIDNSAGAFTVTDTRSDPTLCGRKLRMEAGSGTTGTIASGATGSVAVTFAKPFDEPPSVIAHTSTTAPATRRASAYGVTTTGFTVYAYQNSGSSIAVNYVWQAIGA